MGRYGRRYNDDVSIEGIIALFIIGNIITAVKFVYNFIIENYKIILLLAFAILLLWLIILIIIKRKNIKSSFVEMKMNRTINKLKKCSLLYSNIVILNKEYDFEETGPFYDSYNVYRKSDLENCNIDDYLLMTIDKKYQDLLDYKNKYNEVLARYNEYKNKYSELKKYINETEANKLKIKKDIYDECQYRIYNMHKLYNHFDFAVAIYVNYNSKMGRVRDKKYKRYSLDEYNNILHEYFTLKEKNALYEISSKVERAKMSESLRYDILKRDNFRCKICGASAKDGVKLQVDHIIPVSKGGKTESGNLQTLCSRCNIGKSNKMD